MENMKGKALKLKGDLTLVSIEDQASLLDVENRCYYDPNDTAFFLLKLMEDGILYDDMSAALVSEYDVDEITARLELDSFVAELLKIELVDIKEGGTASRNPLYKAQRNKKAFHSPLLKQQSEIAVAAASTPVTAAN